MLTFIYHPVQTTKSLITASGIVSLEEDFYKPYGEDARSRIKATFSGVTYSGLIDRLYYEIYEYEDTFADNVIEFIAVPSGMEWIEIAGVKYHFYNTISPVISGINFVRPGGGWAYTAAYNLYCALIGKPDAKGTYYSSNVLPHPLVSGLYADNPLYIQATASGISGNTLSIIPDPNSQAIIIRNKFFTKGKDFEFKDSYLEGYVVCSGNINTSYYLPDIPSSDYGLRYMIKLWFANSSGLQAVDTNLLPVTYINISPKIYGQSYMPFFVEVSGLTCPNLVEGKLPSDGVVHLSWDDMTLYSGLHGNGLTQTGTQFTYEATGLDLAQDLVYLIIAHNGSSPPNSLPRYSGAIWLPMGLTRKTNATLRYNDIANKSHVYSFWVGFGNAKTFGLMNTIWANRMISTIATMDPD